MPDTENPKIETWIPYLAKSVGRPDENTYFVGHSIGCQTILRYLDSIVNAKVGGVVLVAGWFFLENLEDAEKPIAKPWLGTSIDFSKVKKTTNKFVVILSDNDPYGAVDKNRKSFEKNLDAKVIIENNKRHFSGSDGITELPSALNAILEISGE